MRGDLLELPLPLLQEECVPFPTLPASAVKFSVASDHAQLKHSGTGWEARPRGTYPLFGTPLDSLFLFYSFPHSEPLSEERHCRLFKYPNLAVGMWFALPTHRTCVVSFPKLPSNF